MPRKKTSFILVLIAFIFVLGFVYLFYSNSNTTQVPSYLSEQFTTSLEKKHLFTIVKNGDNYSLVDTTNQNEYLISATSTITVDEYVDKKFYLTGKLLTTQNNETKVLSAEDNNISAVVAHIDSIEVLE